MAPKKKPQNKIPKPAPSANGGGYAAASSSSAAAAAAPSTDASDSWLSSLSESDRRLAEQQRFSGQAELDAFKLKMQEKETRARTQQENQMWKNKQNEEWERQQRNQRREKERTDNNWKKTVEKLVQLALTQGVVRGQEYPEGWYAEIGPNIWKEVQGDMYCKLCDKQLNSDTSLQGHLESQAHKNKVEWMRSESGATSAAASGSRCPVVPSASTASSSLPHLAMDPSGNIKCLACDKHWNEDHEETAAHKNRLEYWTQQKELREGGWRGPALPYLCYVPDDLNNPDEYRTLKCLVCNKWCNDETSHSGTWQAPSGSKEHVKNLSNYGRPGRDNPWYETNVVAIRNKWHPPARQPPQAPPQASSSNGNAWQTAGRRAPAPPPVTPAQGWEYGEEEEC